MSLVDVEHLLIWWIFVRLRRTAIVDLQIASDLKERISDTWRSANTWRTGKGARFRERLGYQIQNHNRDFSWFVSPPRFRKSTSLVYKWLFQLDEPHLSPQSLHRNNSSIPWNLRVSPTMPGFSQGNSRPWVRNPMAFLVVWIPFHSHHLNLLGLGCLSTGG